jgi:ABC-2 type transport system ATP-binding protein
MDTPMIEARDLVKSYGETRALRGISFAVPRGQIVGFLGPNGAGKTTTMRILTGFLRPTAGEAVVQGRAVASDSLFTRSKIGYQPENAPLYDEMMVVEFLQFVAQMRAIPVGDRSRRLRRVVETCGLGEVLGKDIGQLSKGFRQRVGLAQAMIHDPDILILDEPTSGLDPNQIAEIRNLVRELGREKTLILSTHILPEVQATCTRVIIISDGALVADDSIEHLTEAGGGGRLRLLVAPRDSGALDADHLSAAFGRVEGVRHVAATAGEEEGTVRLVVLTTPEADPRRGLFAAAVAADVVLLEIHRETVSLEETFRKLTARSGGAHA